MGITYNLAWGIGASISAIPSCFMLIAFTVQTRRSKLNPRVQTFPMLLCLAFLTCVPCTLYFLVNGPYWILTETTSLSNNDVFQFILSVLRDMVFLWLYAGLSAFIPLLYLLRLYLTFKESTFALAHKTIILYLIFIFIGTVIAGIGCIYGITSTNIVWDSLTFYFFIGATFVSIPVTVCICVQFSIKLFYLSEMQRNSIQTSSLQEQATRVIKNSRETKMSINANNYHLDIEYNQNQQRLIQIITKQSLLVFVGFCSILFYDIIRTIYIINIANENNDEDDINVYLLVIYAFASYTVGLVTPLSIWLSFAFASKQYDCICSKCDQYFRDCCQDLVTRKTKQRIFTEVSMNYSHL